MRRRHEGRHARGHRRRAPRLRRDRLVHERRLPQEVPRRSSPRRSRRRRRSCAPSSSPRPARRCCSPTRCSATPTSTPCPTGPSSPGATSTSAPMRDISFMGQPQRRLLRREATGVVGAITPWNFPLYLNLCKLGPALAAGNSVVLKPAPDTPWSATNLGRLVAEHTDIPAGVVNVVASSDHGVGEILATRPARRPRDLHRLDRNRPARDGVRLRHGEEGVPRARRQVGADRARRRRPRRRCCRGWA